MTAHNSAEQHEVFIAGGMDAILTKPLSQNTLLSELHI
jgi:CheY-like chemotaxis protein